MRDPGDINEITSKNVNGQREFFLSSGKCK